MPGSNLPARYIAKYPNDEAKPSLLASMTPSLGVSGDRIQDASPNVRNPSYSTAITKLVTQSVLVRVIISCIKLLNSLTAARLKKKFQWTPYSVTFS